jgi:RNA polymerase sigma-70 factor (ECF subfamily)
MQQSDEITGNLFREESGKLLASVIHLLGAANLDVAEDIVQDTMMAALNQWRFQLPENPRAWLYRVVKNKTIDFIRQKKKLVELSPLLLSEWTIGSEVEKSFSDKEIKDNQLRMMFACCHPDLAKPAQIAFMLKTLCGLSVKEISRVFLTGEETITKRLYRAREKFRQLGKDAINVPAAEELPHRLQPVLKCIYLIFTESYFSLSDENVMRKDLCREAIYLCENLALHPVTASHEVYALLALMCFHASRFDARMNARGEILTFEEQNRKLWDRQLIKKGSVYLDRSIGGDHLTAYHIEAMIAAHYSLSSDAEGIDWQAILWLYDQLLLMNASDSVKINRAYVLSKAATPAAAIAYLLSPQNIRINFFYYMMLGELYKLEGQLALSKQHFIEAGKLVQPGKIKQAIDNKVNELASLQ